MTNTLSWHLHKKASTYINPSVRSGNRPIWTILLRHVSGTSPPARCRHLQMHPLAGCYWSTRKYNPNRKSGMLLGCQLSNPATKEEHPSVLQDQRGKLSDPGQTSASHHHLSIGVSHFVGKPRGHSLRYSLKALSRKLRIVPQPSHFHQAGPTVADCQMEAESDGVIFRPQLENRRTARYTPRYSTSPHLFAAPPPAFAWHEIGTDTRPERRERSELVVVSS
jgi:hypothetical protein